MISVDLKAKHETFETTNNINNSITQRRRESGEFVSFLSVSAPLRDTD